MRIECADWTFKKKEVCGACSWAQRQQPPRGGGGGGAFQLFSSDRKG